VRASSLNTRPTIDSCGCSEYWPLARGHAIAERREHWLGDWMQFARRAELSPELAAAVAGLEQWAVAHIGLLIGLGAGVAAETRTDVQEACGCP
jgi:hypothetical protein